MKTANELAQKVEDKDKFSRQYPVGKVQQQVLDALNITVKVNGHSHAQQIFDTIGIVVGSKRQGRAALPVVSVNEGGAYRNAGGDYDVWSGGANCDISALAQWME